MNVVSTSWDDANTGGTSILESLAWARKYFIDEADLRYLEHQRSYFDNIVFACDMTIRRFDGVGCEEVLHIRADAVETIARIEVQLSEALAKRTAKQ